MTPADAPPNLPKTPFTPENLQNCLEVLNAIYKEQREDIEARIALDRIMLLVLKYKQKVRS